jgi:hypothetical protein
MDNIQKHNICTNVPSSQTSRSYSHSTVAQTRSEPSTSQVQTYSISVTSPRSVDKGYCSSVYIA